MFYGTRPWLDFEVSKKVSKKPFLYGQKSVWLISLLFSASRVYFTSLADKY